MPALTLPRKPIRGADQLVGDAGLRYRMAGTLDDVEIGIRPDLRKLPGIFERAGHVVATMHDDARKALELHRIAQQLPFLEPAAIHEIVVLDARKGERE